MATIEACLFYKLTHDAVVTAVAGTRGFPMVVPLDTTLPAWAYQLISSVPDQTHTGPSHLEFRRFQVTCIGDRYEDAIDLAEAIQADLNGFTGLMGGTGARYVTACQVENVMDGYGGPQEPLFEQKVRRMDVIIWYQR